MGIIHSYELNTAIKFNNGKKLLNFVGSHCSYICSLSNFLHWMIIQDQYTLQEIPNSKK